MLFSSHKSGEINAGILRSVMLIVSHALCTAARVLMLKGEIAKDLK